MQTLPAIFAGSFIIGFSGAIMPGPMLTVTIREAGQRGFWAGPLVVLGHGLLELALVVALLQGLDGWLQAPQFTGTVGLVGGAMLLVMAVAMLRGLPGLRLQLEGSTGRGRGGAVLGGVLTSLSNPYWTLWWATVGMGYLTLTRGTGVRGTVAFFAGHILSDLVWFTLIAALIHYGRRFCTDRVYRWLVGGCALLLLYFAAIFTRSGWRTLASLG
ncbi:MAG: LysE family transporter [Deferrisomatales bacterium]|nr:LysE family transporter [Deferrisomatales bacterium]